LNEPGRDDGPRDESGPTSSDVPEPTLSRYIELHELLGAAREVHILHGGEIYRLRLTSKGKLILTK
jgi:hemin uptake protein HemP